MSTFGFRPILEVWAAIAAGFQSPTLPSIVIGYIGPAGFAGPRRGRRSRAPLMRGITYSFHRAIADSRWNRAAPDRKSTRLNSSHDQISYAVFCLKKTETQAA